MSEKKINFKIITPEKIVFSGEVDSITAQGVRGSFGVLPDHIPFMTTLDIDTAKAMQNGKELIFSIIGGAFQFKNDEAVILTEAAECSDDIDAPRAQLAKERAQAKLSNAENQKDIKIANAALARALARLKAASKR